MKFHGGTHSGTAVSSTETVNFSIVMKRGEDNNQAEILHDRVIGSEGGAIMDL